jgi:hypothetical protein
MTYFITYHLKQWKSISLKEIHRSKAKKRSYKLQSLLDSSVNDRQAQILKL